MVVIRRELAASGSQEEAIEAQMEEPSTYMVDTSAPATAIVVGHFSATECGWNGWVGNGLGEEMIVQEHITSLQEAETYMGSGSLRSVTPLSTTPPTTLPHQDEPSSTGRRKTWRDRGKSFKQTQQLRQVADRSSVHIPGPRTEETLTFPSVNRECPPPHMYDQERNAHGTPPLSAMPASITALHCGSKRPHTSDGHYGQECAEESDYIAGSSASKKRCRTASIDAVSHTEQHLPQAQQSTEVSTSAYTHPPDSNVTSNRSPARLQARRPTPFTPRSREIAPSQIEEDLRSLTPPPPGYQWVKVEPRDENESIFQYPEAHYTSTYTSSNSAAQGYPNPTKELQFPHEPIPDRVPFDIKKLACPLTRELYAKERRDLGRLERMINDAFRDEGPRIYIMHYLRYFDLTEQQRREIGRAQRQLDGSVLKRYNNALALHLDSERSGETSGTQVTGDGTAGPSVQAPAAPHTASNTVCSSCRVAGGDQVASGVAGPIAQPPAGNTITKTTTTTSRTARRNPISLTLPPVGPNYSSSRKPNIVVCAINKALAGIRVGVQVNLWRQYYSEMAKHFAALVRTDEGIRAKCRADGFDPDEFAKLS